MKKILIAGVCVVAVAASCACAYGHVNMRRECILNEVTIETGSAIDLNAFLTEPLEDCGFYTDVSAIDTSVPGSYGVVIKFSDFGKEFHQEAVLNVVDTTAPVGVAVPQMIYCGQLPDASCVVTDISDLAPVTVSYASEPDVSNGGEFLFDVVLTDAYGNEGVVQVPFTVIDDHTAPLIYGAHDIEAFIGHSISYLDGITVTDNYDEEPELNVDTSQIDVSTPGEYPVTYTVSDENGNEDSVTITLTLRVEPERYYEVDVLYDLCRELNEQYQIYTEDMTDIEKAFRIFHWAHNNVYYAGVADKTDWTCAAYDGLTTLRGDCYTYYAVCRAFLDMEGIPNILMTRYPVTWSPHYWNLVYLDGAWYHCDALAFSAVDGYYFMCSEQDINPYDHRYDPEAIDPDILAGIAQEPVQQYVHYSTLEVDEIPR